MRIVTNQSWAKYVLLINTHLTRLGLIILSDSETNSIADATSARVDENGLASVGFAEARVNMDLVLNRGTQDTIKEITVSYHTC